jgi:prepilin-type N-terminal cleavage/methylation domain-containing protein
MNSPSTPRAAGIRHASFVIRHSRIRRGFNLIELLIALAITAALLTATLVSLNASFMAYQTTTEVASTHSISRMALYRMLTMIRMGKEFGPFPANPLDSIVSSDFMEFETPDGQIMTLNYVEADEKLNVEVLDPDTGVENTYTLLEGVIRQNDINGDPLAPFTLQYEKGRNLYRATIDLMVRPDDNMDVMIEGDNSNQTIRLVASAMPRLAAY